MSKIYNFKTKKLIVDTDKKFTISDVPAEFVRSNLALSEAELFAITLMIDRASDLFMDPEISDSEADEVAVVINLMLDRKEQAILSRYIPQGTTELLKLKKS
jgi:hypothetical protein